MSKREIISAANRILRKASKDQQHSYLQYGDKRTGKQVITDGVRAVQLVEHDEIDIPYMPEELLKTTEPFDFESYIPEDFFGTFNLPKIKNLKQAIKAKKKEMKDNGIKFPYVIYSFGKDKYVNASYLVDIMTILEISEVKYSILSLTPVYAENIYGSKGLLMPFRCCNENVVITYDDCEE